MKNPALISKIKSLDALSANEKAELIALLNNTKKYGLVWEDKPEDVEELLRTQLPVLQEVPERRILAKDLPARAETTLTKTGTSQPGLFDDENTDRPDNALRLRSGLDPGNRALSEADRALSEANRALSGVEAPTLEVEAPTLKAEAPNHILIEGDNLHALTALTFTHEGKIDVIYIDPPYNTGNKDFKYNDHFVDREDSYRHSKWLSFMHKRLQIAKRLLSDKGVIFISIDDNEQAQLKLLCDEIFGEQNFVANNIWEKIHSIKNDAKYLSINHEFVLLYAKNIEWLSINLLDRTNEMDSRYKNPDNDPRGPWQSGDLAANETRKDGNYDVINPRNGKIFNVPSGKHWVYSRENMASLIMENRIWFGKDGNAFPRKKRFLSEVKEGRKGTTWWESNEVGHNQEAKRELKEFFIQSEDLFSTPKPLKLITRTLNLSSQNNSIVLDFFAGSGTTLHATMQLNAEDGGNRQCILVTNNENNIAEEVCYERNRRVIGGYTNSKGQWVEGLPNNNFRYYKTEFVGSAKTEANRRKLTRLSTALLQIKEDCYHDLTASAGFDTESCHISANGSGRYLVVIYHNRRRPELIEQLREWIKTLPVADEKIRMYAFSEEKEVLLDEFYDVASRIMAVPLPDAIYNAYRATFRTLGFDRKQPQQNGNPAGEAPATDEMPELDFNQTEE